MAPHTQVLYATLPRRVKASIIDGVILITLFIVPPLLISTLLGNDTGLNATAMFVPPLLLEPFLITYFGSTIGQYIFGIQVINADTGKKCSFIKSFVRYLTKLPLGAFSLVYMLFSNKHQAIHDIAAKSLVVLSTKRIAQNPSFANYGESEQNHEKDSAYQYPSSLRRFLFFCLWFVLSSFLFGLTIELIALSFIPGYTLETENLPKHIDIATDVIGSIIFISIAVLASKGYLPGAKRKKRQPATL